MYKSSSSWNVRKNAYKVFRYALKHKYITRPDHCEICSTGLAKIEGHHPDYNKPLLIWWLCTFCHKKLHKLQLRLNPYVEQVVMLKMKPSKIQGKDKNK